MVLEQRDQELDSRALRVIHFLYQLEPPVLRSVLEILEWVLNRLDHGKALPGQIALNGLMSIVVGDESPPSSEYREDDVPF